MSINKCIKLIIVWNISNLLVFIDTPPEPPARPYIWLRPCLYPSTPHSLQQLSKFMFFSSSPRWDSLFCLSEGENKTLFLSIISEPVRPYISKTIGYYYVREANFSRLYHQV